MRIYAALTVAAIVATVSGCSSSGEGSSQWYKRGWSAAQSLGGQYVGNYGADNQLSNQECVNYWNENMPGAADVPEGTPIEQYSDGWVAACEGAPYGQVGSPASLPPAP